MPVAYLPEVHAVQDVAPEPVVSIKLPSPQLGSNTEFFFDVSLNSIVNKTIEFVFASGLVLTGKSFVWFKSLKFHVGHFESSRSFMEIKTAKVTKGRSFLAHYTANRVGRLTKSIQQS